MASKMGLYAASKGQFMKTWLLRKRAGTIYVETDANSSRMTFDMALSIVLVPNRLFRGGR
jgi:hypothetical protein